MNAPMTDTELRAEVDRLQIELDRLGVERYKDNAELSLYGRVMALTNRPNPAISEMRERAKTILNEDSRTAAIPIKSARQVWCTQYMENGKSSSPTAIKWAADHYVDAEETREFAFALLAIAEVADEWEKEASQ